MTEFVTLITVLRHGAVDGRQHVLRGALDEPLSAAGRAELDDAARRLAQPVYSALACSPLRRCQDFAQDYARELGLPLAVLPGLREIHFGEWEGLSPAEVEAVDGERYRRFRRGECAAPGGESLTELRARVEPAWQDWLAESDGGHRLLVTHAGVMRALLVTLFGLPAERLAQIALPPAAHLRISHLPGAAPVLLSLNGPCAD